MSEPVKLAPRLDLSAASQLKATLTAQEDEDLVLDFSEVKFLGALCLQVLLAVAAHAATAGRKMTILNVSDRVIDQMRLMGMTPELIARGQQ